MTYCCSQNHGKQLRMGVSPIFLKSCRVIFHWTMIIGELQDFHMIWVLSLKLTAKTLKIDGWVSAYFQSVLVCLRECTPPEPENQSDWKGNSIWIKLPWLWVRLYFGTFFLARFKTPPVLPRVLAWGRNSFPQIWSERIATKRHVRVLRLGHFSRKQQVFG